MTIFAGYKVNKAISIILSNDASSPEVRQATQNIKKLGSSALPKLIDALSNGKNTSTLETILLTNINNSNLDIFIKALAHNNSKIVRSITRVLTKSDNYDPNHLLSYVTLANISLESISTILIHHKAIVNVNEILKILDSVPSNVRPNLYQIISAAVTEKALGSLIIKTKSSEPFVRAYIANLLNRFNTPDSVNTLIKLLGDPNKIVRESALKSLGILNADNAVVSICELLSDSDLTVQSAAIDALITINSPETIKHLIDVLQDESEYVRRAAVEVLNEVGDQRAIKDLLNALRDADWWVKVRAADALGSIGGPKVIDAVLALIKDDDDFMRRTAVEILNTCKDKKAFDHLVVALNDEDWWVRERAADALALLGDKRAVKPLIELLNTTPEACKVAIKALTALGDNRAIRPLLNQLSNESKTIRKVAMSALTHLTDEEHASLVKDKVTELVNNTSLDIQDAATEMIQTLHARFGVDSKIINSNTVDNSSQSKINLPKISTDNNSSIIDIDLNYVEPEFMKSGDIFYDRYRIIREIGQGAFGVVVLVEDIMVNDEFILKFLNPQIAREKNMLKRFTHELRYARKITHNNIIRIYDFISDGKMHAISMEYFPSHSLKKEIYAPNKPALQHSLKIFYDICAGMESAQASNVVHRDLKPGNILINDNREVKIVDFGLAAVASHADTRLTKTGFLVGTPTYMAPEQIRGQAIDSKTDIYSVGIMMYEMFTGTVPYSGEESMGIMFQHVEGNAKKPTDLNPNIPIKLEQVIMQAMSVKPESRFNNFTEFKNKIQNLMERE